jgi:hypothetical protein
MNPKDGLSKHHIFTDPENKKRCYGEEDLNRDEPILFLHGPFIIDDEETGEERIIKETVCLNHKEASDILREIHINHFVGGYRDEQIKDIRYFVTMMDERKNKIKQRKKYKPADISELRYRPRKIEPLTKEKESSDLQRIYNDMKLQEFDTSSETSDYIRRQKGMFLHSKDMNTPSFIRQDTGEQSFHNMGRLLMKKLPDGRNITYSIKTGRPVD